MALFKRWKNVFHSGSLDAELREEMEFHLASRAEAYIKEGLPPRQARERASREFGNAAALAERVRDVHVAQWLDGLWQDVRYGARQLRRNPAFAAISITSLALGIGATAALFAVIDAVLLKPLPVPQPQELVQFEDSRRGETRGGAPARLRDFQAARSFRAVAGFYSEGISMRADGGPIRISALRTFGPVTEVMQVTPALGRTFTSQEEIGIGPPVALLTDRLWRNHFASAPEALGRTLSVGSQPCTIIGVLPPVLDFPENVDLWIPAPDYFQNLNRSAAFLEIVGRLAPGATLSSAASEMETVNVRLAKDHVATDADVRTSLTPLHLSVVHAARLPLFALFGAVASLLLVACVNIAGLMLSRASARQRESGVRVALGAGTTRLLRLRFLEVCWVSAIGGALGVLLAAEALDAVSFWLPMDLPRLHAVRLDSRVVLFAAFVSALSALLAGVIPAWLEARGTVTVFLKRGSAGSLGAGGQRFRSALVVGQVALSMTLLLCAALLGRSLLRQQRVPLGFRAESSLGMTTSFAWNAPDTAIRSFTSGVLAQLAALPGVIDAGVVDRLPLRGGAQSSPVAVRGRALDADLATQTVGFRAANAGYFRALGIPVLSGSLFPDPVDAASPKLAVVNERFARRFFPDENAVGQLIQARATSAAVADNNWLRITGVVGNVRTNLQEGDPLPEVYQAWGQVHWPLISFVVRTSVDPVGLASAMRLMAAKVDPDQPIEAILPLTTLLPESTASSRTETALVASFAVAALFLSAVGLYGLMMGEVATRTREFGLRLALGAAPAALLRSALGRGMRLVLLGLLLGTVGAAAAARLMRSLLFEVQPDDAPSALVAAVVLTVAGIAACWLPAWRAARIDPAVTLRAD